MFAWLRIIATWSIGVFNSFGGQIFPSQAPGSPVYRESGKSTRGAREAGEHAPRAGFRDESVVGLASKPLLLWPTDSLLNTFTNLIPCLVFVQ
jgi:hypothetical protein